jgi:LysM repeat protein
MPVRTHVVQSGDILIRIAEQHGTTLEVLLGANPQITDPDVIHVGDVIVLPDAGGDPGAGPGDPGGAPGGPAVSVTHTVRSGDNLSALGARFGVTVDALLAANPSITNPDIIFIGQVLTIPAAASPAAASPAAASPGGASGAERPDKARGAVFLRGGGVPVRDWTQEPLAVRIRHVMKLLVEQHGYSAEAAAGIVGNLLQESGVIPNRLEGSRSATPMRAKRANAHGPGDAEVDFTAEEIMDPHPETGPWLKGIGLAQWTFPSRRRGLFAHTFDGRRLGAAIVFDMDAQVDYLVTELRTTHRRVDDVLRRPGVGVEEACDMVTLEYERPGGVLDAHFNPLPATDPGLLRVLDDRRQAARSALDAFVSP